MPATLRTLPLVMMYSSVVFSCAKAGAASNTEVRGMGRIRICLPFLSVGRRPTARSPRPFSQTHVVRYPVHLNLSVHLRKLEEANYIAIEKTFRDRRPLTRARLT